MFTKRGIYGAIEKITPPFLFTFIRHSVLYRAARTIARTLLPEPEPTIATITNGTLKGFKLKLRPEGAWQQLMLTGTYDKELFELIKSFNLTGGTMYDIGAHTGYHSLYFATIVGPSGHVYAFEPNRTNFLRTQENISLNPSTESIVTAFDYALSDRNGHTDFLGSNDLEGGSSSGSFIDDAATIWTRSDYIEKSGFVTNQVETRTVDSLVEDGNIEPPTLMKIDVEGAEQLVLAGAKNTLTKFRPRILVEFHSIYATYACMDIFAALNYRTEIINREADGRIMVLATSN